MKLDTLQFALAGGIITAICMAWMTVASLIGVPGFLPFAKLIEQGYGFYGYSVSWTGVFIGAFYGFVEGFIWLGALAVIYNKLIK